MSIKVEDPLVAAENLAKLKLAQTPQDADDGGGHPEIALGHDDEGEEDDEGDDHEAEGANGGGFTIHPFLQDSFWPAALTSSLISRCQKEEEEEEV